MAARRTAVDERRKYKGHAQTLHYLTWIPRLGGHVTPFNSTHSLPLKGEEKEGHMYFLGDLNRSTCGFPRLLTFFNPSRPDYRLGILREVGSVK